jgi:hypothetical protein
MESIKPSISTGDSAVEMISAVIANAERDAVCVHQFLKQLRLAGTPKRPVALPRGFLLYLAAALRLLAWERGGLFLHREVGLPGAQQAIGDAFRWLAEPDTDVTAFCISVMKLSMERFAWSGLCEIRTDVAIDEAHEELLLDALADFLWAHRPV